MSVGTEPVSRRSQGLRVEGIALQTSLLACGRPGLSGPEPTLGGDGAKSSVWPRFWAVRAPVGRLERVFAESGTRSRRIPDSAFSPPRRSGSLNSAVSLWVYGQHFGRVRNSGHVRVVTSRRPPSYVDSVYVVDVTFKRMSHLGCTFTQSATSPSASAYGNSAATPGSRSPPSPLAPTSRPRSSPISSTIGRFRRSNDCNASPRRWDLTPAVCCPAFGDSAIRRFGPAESPSVRSCGDYLQQPFTATVPLRRRQRNSAWSPLSRIRRCGQRDDRKVWGQGAV